ncbi:hypothetical protein [Arthrobacter sp. NPDC080082]|uniref:hypothetical protein n=1 Tax=unclassified Arthrobacter TaxID=235627 RepID=UPI00341F2B02
MSTITSNRGVPEPEEHDRDAQGSRDPADSVRRQAEAIIETVLASGTPADTQKLSELVAAFPGRPEAALAQFLREVRPSISDYDGPLL